MIAIPPLDQHVHRFIINYKPERGPDVYVKTVTTFGDRPETIMAVTVMRKLQRWFKRATQRLLKQLQRMIMSRTFLTRSKTRKKPKHQSRRQNTRAWTARHHWMCRRANTVGFAACCRTQTQWWSSSVRRHAPSKWSHSAWTSSNSYSGRDTPGDLLKKALKKANVWCLFSSRSTSAHYSAKSQWLPRRAEYLWWYYRLWKRPSQARPELGVSSAAGCREGTYPQ